MFIGLSHVKNMVSSLKIIKVRPVFDTQHPSTTIQKVLNELPDLWSWSSDFPCLFPCLSLPPLSCFLQGIDSHDSRINSLSADFDRERVTMESTLSSVRQQVTPGSSMHCLTANNQLDSVL